MFNKIQLPKQIERPPKSGGLFFLYYTEDSKNNAILVEYSVLKTLSNVGNLI